MITVLDYGMGNLHSVKNALDYLGVEHQISSDPSDCALANGLILPGVGAFPDAVKALKSSGLFGEIQAACKAGKPLFGICLGMQLLFSESEEFGKTEGLNLIPGRIVPIQAPGLKIPHIGWNQLAVCRPDPVLQGVKSGDYVYFVHSFRADTARENLLCTTNYGECIPALVKNPDLPVWGAQFHPEKSHNVGLSILRAFCAIAEKGASK